MGKDHPNWKKHFCISLKMEHRESITALSKQVAQPCVITTCLILGVRINSYLKKKKREKKIGEGDKGEGKQGSWMQRMQGSHAWVTAWNADGCRRDQGNAAGTVSPGLASFRAGIKPPTQGLTSKMQEGCTGRNLFHWTQNRLQGRINTC